MRYLPLLVLVLGGACYLSHEELGPRLRIDLLVAAGGNEANPPIARVGRLGRFESVFTTGRATELHFQDDHRRWGSREEFWGPLSPDGQWVRSGHRARAWTWHGDSGWFFVGNDPDLPRFDGGSLPSPHWVRFEGGDSTLFPWPEGAVGVAADLDAAGHGWALGSAPGTTEIGGVSLGGVDGEVIFICRLAGFVMGPPVPLSSSEGLHSNDIALLPDGDLLISAASPAGSARVLGERIEGAEFLVRVDPETPRLVDHWVSNAPLVLEGQGREDARVSVSHDSSVTFGGVEYRAVEGAAATFLELTWDGRGELPRATRWVVEPSAIDDEGFWTSFQRHSVETTDAERMIGPIAGPVMWARFDADPTKAALAVRSSVRPFQLLSVVRLDRTVRSVFASTSAVTVGDSILEPLRDAEFTYWVTEMSLDTGALLRVSAFAGPRPTVAIKAIPVGPSHELVAMHEEGRPGITMRLASLEDGGVREVAGPRVEGTSCTVVPTREVGPLDDEPVPSLTLETTCASGAHSVTFGGRTIDYTAPQSVAIYNIGYGL